MSFKQQVIDKLSMPEEESDYRFILLALEQLETQGFNVDDAVSYLSCMQELNPHIEERAALIKMHELKQKYLK